MASKQILISLKNKFYSSSFNNGSKLEDARGKTNYFTIASELHPFWYLNFSITYSDQTYSRKWTDSDNYEYYLDLFSPSELAFGLSYSLFEILKFYFAYVDYKIKYEMRNSN